MPTANSSTLPFAIDGTLTAPIYIALGYEGDYALVRASSSCPDMPTGVTQAGQCHKFTYDWAPDASAPGAPGTGNGWAGVEWQYGQPLGTANWGTQVGYLIPPGATKVSFYAKGAVGGEVVSFAAGGGSSCTTACCDTVSGSLASQALTSSWAQYTIPLTGTYANGVIAGFVWSAGQSSQPGGEAGVADSMTFYIDDIEWTM